MSRETNAISFQEWIQYDQMMVILGLGDDRRIAPFRSDFVPVLFRFRSGFGSVSPGTCWYQMDSYSCGQSAAYVRSHVYLCHSFQRTKRRQVLCLSKSTVTVWLWHNLDFNHGLTGRLWTKSMFWYIHEMYTWTWTAIAIETATTTATATATSDWLLATEFSALHPL